MNRVVFSSWAGNVVDNRGKAPGKYTGLENLDLPLEFQGYKLRAFISWRGLIVADESINILDMALAYLKEVQKTSCGECNVGYNGVNIMTSTLSRILNGQGSKEDIEMLRWLAGGVKENSRCDFCALAATPILDTLNYYGDQYLKLVENKEKSRTRTRYLSHITSPCMENCPAHQDVPRYLELIRNHRYPESLEVIRRTNCLPGVIGRTCVAFCEENCVRKDIDKSLAIRALKRVPADYAVSNNLAIAPERIKTGGVKVAIVGAGPAGLAASYNLALLGYRVTLYDEQAKAGGMALVGIPPYRLPRDVIARESDIITGLGIELKSGTKVGRDVSLDKLWDEGFKAVFIATGAHRDRKPDISDWKPGTDGMVEGIEFLRDINLGKKVAVKDKAIVVGGGNVAIDCARTCLRLGCKDVTIVYRRTRAEMPAEAEEVEAAAKEGVKFQFLAVPVRALTQGNKVSGAECIRMELGAPDESGRRRPVPIKGSEFTIDTAMIISAIGEVPDLSVIHSRESITTTKQGTIAVNLPGYQTAEEGIFSGGDCVSGPASLIEAVAAGNRAAKSIDQFIRTGKVAALEGDLIEGWVHNVGLERQRNGSVVPNRARQQPEELPVTERKVNFNEVECRFSDKAATAEADRCLRCYRVMMMAVSRQR